MKKNTLWTAVFLASFAGLNSATEKELGAIQDKKVGTRPASVIEKLALPKQENIFIQREPFATEDNSAFMCEECPEARAVFNRCCLRFQCPSETGSELRRSAQHEYAVGCICALLVLEKLIMCGLC